MEISEPFLCINKHLPKIELPYNPAIILLDIYSKDTKSLIERDTCTLMVIAALYNSKLCKQPQCPLTDERIKKIYTGQPRWLSGLAPPSARA